MSPGVLIALACVAAVVAGESYAYRQKRLLHLLQLEHYENARLMVWLVRRGELRPAPWPLYGATLGVLIVATITDLQPIGVAGCALLIAASVRTTREEKRRTAIKPLVWTDRAKRVHRVALALPAVPLLALLVVAIVTGDEVVGLAAALLAVAALILAPYLMLVANRAMLPVQNRINDRFVQSAKRALAEAAPLVVGITGSYGKTTTKFCIGAVLDEDRPTLVTPESYNSFLGVVRTINEKLERRHEAFVVEMGMYRQGDIAELCELVAPTIGVLTSIGPMHLERLGTIENIAAAKAELMESLPADGTFVTNADDPRCREIAARARSRVLLFGIADASADVRAEAIRTADGRTHFDLVVPGGRAPVSVDMLGAHNVANLLAAAAVGHAVGMAPDAIARGLATAEAPPHRLQTIHNRAANVLVIDDSYNSNPAGARAALEVLRDHPAGRRILVTPGMVELGDLEVEANRELGRLAAEACQIAILVGVKRTEPIREGLLEAGFPESAITVVRDIAGATEVLAGLTRSGDVVLFENDLPDLYSEDDAPASSGTAAR